MKPVPLREAEDEDRFGGKARQLGAALRAGLPVPDGVAMSVELVDAIARGEGPDDPGLAAWLEGVAPRVAVRSSASGEDSNVASFAGQHATVLNVRSVASLREAILEVWRSGRTEAALSYRKKLGVTSPPRLGVVVQAMVLSDVAGVMFTKNPITGADERVIEAAWGLGEAVVSGLVTPDRFRLERGGKLLEREIGDKDLEIRWLDDGTEESHVPPERATAPCLDDDALQVLEALAARCDQTFDGPHDIEWAFAGGSLFLLQRRPITR